MVQGVVREQERPRWAWKLGSGSRRVGRGPTCGGAGSREGRGGEDTLKAPLPAPLPPQPCAMGSHASLRRGTAGDGVQGVLPSGRQVRGAHGGPARGRPCGGLGLLGVSSPPPCVPVPQPSLGTEATFPGLGD